MHELVLLVRFNHKQASEGFRRYSSLGMTNWCTRVGLYFPTYLNNSVTHVSRRAIQLLIHVQLFLK